MEDEANVEVDIFISKDQQRALALDVDDISVENWLTKGDTAPPAAKSDDLLDMNDSARELMAKVYTDSVVKEVSTQYSSIISNMNADMGDKDDKINHLLMELNKLKSSQLPKYDQVLQDNDELEGDLIEQESEDRPLTVDTAPKSSTQTQRIDVLDSNIHSPSKDKPEVMDPHEEGTISTSSSSQRHSKKRGMGYDSRTSQNSKGAIDGDSLALVLISTPTSLTRSLQTNKDQGEDMSL